MDLTSLVEMLGAETVLQELEQWMPTDELNEFINDVKKDYDLDEK